MARAIIDQPGLFDADPRLPAGFASRSPILTADEEADLVTRLATLPFRPFEFHGFHGARRVVSFGWRYDYARERAEEAEPMPDFLAALRARAAVFGAAPEAFHQALVTEYAPGAGIGWHRDKAVFDEVVGVSLLAPCVMRFRRRTGAGWDRAFAPLAPRSAYLLSGPARTDWEHSIRPMEALRYSVTFRSLRDSVRARANSPPSDSIE
jgi:alkylated DNA repair dioxygenase AlkB